MTTVTVTRIDDALRRISQADRVLQRVIGKRWPERDETDTDIRWGRAGDYPDDGGGPQIISPLPPEDDEDEPPGIIEYDEYQRITEEVRVENPDDASQYVIVERVTRILFVGRDDGRVRAFNLRYE